MQPACRDRRPCRGSARRHGRAVVSVRTGRLELEQIRHARGLEYALEVRSTVVLDLDAAGAAVRLAGADAHAGPEPRLQTLLELLERWVRRRGARALRLARPPALRQLLELPYAQTALPHERRQLRLLLERRGGEESAGVPRRELAVADAPLQVFGEVLQTQHVRY